MFKEPWKIWFIDVMKVVHKINENYSLDHWR